MEKTLESPLDCKEIQPVHPKGDQSWVFIGGTDAEAETPILWPSDVKSWLIWKDPDAGKDWGQEEKGATEGEMVGWHHWLNGDEFEQTPGVGDGQGGLACCGPWGRKELDMTELLNWTEDLYLSRICVLLVILFLIADLHTVSSHVWWCLVTLSGLTLKNGVSVGSFPCILFLRRNFSSQGNYNWQLCVGLIQPKRCFGLYSSLHVSTALPFHAVGGHGDHMSSPFPSSTRLL